MESINFPPEVSASINLVLERLKQLPENVSIEQTYTLLAGMEWDENVTMVRTKYEVIVYFDTMIIAQLGSDLSIFE